MPWPRDTIGSLHNLCFHLRAGNRLAHAAKLDVTLKSRQLTVDEFGLPLPYKSFRKYCRRAFTVFFCINDWYFEYELFRQSITEMQFEILLVMR